MPQRTPKTSGIAAIEKKCNNTWRSTSHNQSNRLFVLFLLSKISPRHLISAVDHRTLCSPLKAFEMRFKYFPVNKKYYRYCQALVSYHPWTRGLIIPTTAPCGNSRWNCKGNMSACLLLVLLSDQDVVTHSYTHRHLGRVSELADQVSVYNIVKCGTCPPVIDTFWSEQWDPAKMNYPASVCQHIWEQKTEGTK